ncbi:hydantoinase B/oxoprolinase family protein [Agrobacterium tumefaciens]|uniref:hydantoinase B/oxoprolinase family protein n=1 Tax=Agrobacterium tumefaciens TaxID=358 RepID=UPI0021D351C2|nr:hydantoinase B/oxoprolinase family protein [Agrobacterium tumefaciens]UXS04590.1 methylhydantoinase [Agrobacterium tumefaciens]
MQATGQTTGKRLRAGVDIGGTFTDFILFDESATAIRLHKCLTTPRDPSQGALGGLGELVKAAGIGISDLSEIVHGTTLVTNAVIERKGAAVGLITTEGFRDILEIGTEQRYDIYDLTLAFPTPLVERSRRLEVSERIDADGNVILDLDEVAILRAAETLKKDGVEAIAICFMHSYRNPAHERRARDIIAKALPELSISISCEVVAEISEYQRFVTTCANAYVQPLMDRYLRRFEGELATMGFAGDFRLMHSAGGLVSLETARAFPIRLLESGPAGGALATAWFGKNAGHDNVIAFDMGGTTAKACLIEDGKIDIASYLEAGREHRFKNGSGLPIKSPVVDMIEIGAGGGSIASIDGVGLLQVGPHSASSEPGPACYGRGGLKPTVTDASVALGYYDPSFFLGGRMTLDLAAAEKALGTIAKPLNISAVEAAWGIHQVVSESMASAARIHLVEKGKDPRGYSMIGFGGAGPAFAAKVARILGVSEVIIPPASGAASAFGFLTAPLSFDIVRSHPIALSKNLEADKLNDILDEISEDGRVQLRSAGVANTDILVERSADMRLVGQLHEINVPLPAGTLDAGAYAEIRKAFEAVYSARYTRVPSEAKLEILSFRIRASGAVPHLTVRQAGIDGSSTDARKGTRKTYFGNGFVDAGIYDRYSMRTGILVEGPAIIEERESTTIIPPGDKVTVDETGNLRIQIAETAKGATIVDETMSLEEASKRIQADPIALEVMWSRLVNVAEEMWSTVCRTAFSLIISESQDFGCAILDPHGETLAHSARVMPVFNLTLPMAVKAIIERYPVDTMKPGDVYITNDPWLCAGHLFDLAIVTPVFHRGRVVALMGTVGHVGDIGGSRDGLNVTELYEEGIQIPAMKLVREGAENEDLFRLMADNIRDSDQVLGDVRSFISANETGSARMRSFMEEYGMHDLKALSHVVQSLSEKAMRDAVSKLKDGVYHSEISNNPMGSTMTFPIKVTVKGDEIELDFEGAPPQTVKGGINCTLSYTTAHATYPIKCMLTPGIRGNAGCYRPFTVKAPKGSILNCEKPAPVSLRTRTGWYLAPNVFRALSDAAPETAQSFSGLPSLMSFYGKSVETGALFYELLLLGGGQGASQTKDGKSSLLWPTSAATSSLEMFETRSPIVIWEKSLMTDSGGAGENRGGLGVRVRISRRNSEGHPIKAIVSPEGVDLPVEGLFGGKPGKTATGKILAKSSGELLRDCGTGAIVDLIDTNTVVELTLAGGSGYGDPMNRDLDKLDDDVKQGYVSADTADRIYGRAARQGERKKPGTAA